MAASSFRNTPTRNGTSVKLKVAASTVIYAGTLVAINASGYAVPASDTAGLKVFGRAEDTCNNQGAAGDASVIVTRGVFLFANDSTKAVAQANVGGVCYAKDDETVASETTNSIVAGLVLEITSSGVWVDTVIHPVAVAAATQSNG